MPDGERIEWRAVLQTDVAVRRELAVSLVDLFGSAPETVIQDMSNGAA